MNWTKKILDFNNSAEYNDLAAYYSQPSIFSALGVSRHENTHSNFLAWLLTPRPKKNDHGLGDLPLRKLLETLALVCNQLRHAFGKLEPNIINAFITGGYTLSNITVEREKYLDAASRLDIYIEGNALIDGSDYPLRLALENKVLSTEHDTQTERYQTALNHPVSRPEIYLGIYLTPLANQIYESLDEPQCASKDFVQLNYQYIADFLITPCRNIAPDNIRRYLDEYLLALGLPELRQNKGDIIMAISKEERDLLSRFWDSHKDLLIAAMLSMVDSDAIEDDEREVVQKASLALKDASERDTARFTWVFRGGVELTQGAACARSRHSLRAA
jgi:hypothetical protein